jgi:hypothetical protein
MKVEKLIPSTARVACRPITIKDINSPPVPAREPDAVAACVAAAVGGRGGRVSASSRQVDAICVDTAHGHSKNVVDAVGASRSASTWTSSRQRRDGTAPRPSRRGRTPQLGIGPGRSARRA